VEVIIALILLLELRKIGDSRGSILDSCVAVLSGSHVYDTTRDPGVCFKEGKSRIVIGSGFGVLLYS